MAKWAYWHPSDDVAPLAAQSVTLGTADPQFGIGFVTAWDWDSIAVPLLFTSNGPNAVRFDFSSLLEGQRVDYALLWHNLPVGTNVRLQAANVADFSTILLDVGFTVPARRWTRSGQNGGTYKIGVNLTTASGYTTAGFVYYRVYIPTIAIIPGIKVQLFSTIRQTSIDFQFNYTKGPNKIAVAQASQWGWPSRYDLGTAPRSISFPFLGSDTDAQAMRDWLDASGSGPAVFVEDLSVTTDVWLALLMEQTPQSDGSAQTKTLTLTSERQFFNANLHTITALEIVAPDPEWT